MSQGSYLTYRIQYARTCLMMATIYYSHIRISLQRLFYCIQLRLFINRELKIDMWNMIHLTHLYGTCVIGTIVDHKYLFAFRHQRVDANINIDGTRTTEKHRCILVFWCMNYLEQIGAQAFHQTSKLLLARTNIWHYLSHFNRISSGCRTRVQQHISLYLFHFSFL